MKNFLHRHKSFWSDKRLVLQAVAGFLLLFLAIVITFYANLYTTARASNSVTDVILDNTPVVNVDFIFNEGAIVFLAIVAALLLYEPKRMPFALKSTALFFIIRSIFMIMTHLAPPPQQSYIDTADILHKISSGDDLFFSAHTGFPFLLAFIFWAKKSLRIFFIVSSVLAGASVLLGHLHYSIDVFSALFIAFGIFHVAKGIFPANYSLAREVDAAS